MSTRGGISSRGGKSPATIEARKPYLWQKGVSGNPGGRVKLPEHLKAIKALSHLEINRIISKYGRMTFAELIKSLDDENMTVVEKAIAKIFQKSIKDSDFSSLNFLLDRAIGKAPLVEIEDEDDSERAQLSRLSFQELLQVVKNAIPDLNPDLKLDLPKTDGQIVLDAMKDNNEKDN